MSVSIERQPLDASACRRQFPGLARRVGDAPAVFFDGPAGSQVPQRVIDAVGHCLVHTNANQGGVFATSREVDALMRSAHKGVADLLGSNDPDLVAFGPNMTTLTLSLSRALARTWNPGDEIIVTGLEHDANYTPWVLAARDAGARIREVPIRPEDGRLELDAYANVLNSRTRLVAIACASNALGTVQPVAEMITSAHAVGAEVFLDAVHYAPHMLIDVSAWDCEYLACSAYKFFGPHVGVLFGKRDRLEALPAYKLRPAPDDLPSRWMTGTQSHEGIAGTLAAIEYLADLGRSVSAQAASRRDALIAAFAAIREYERSLAEHLLSELSAIPSLKIWGPRDVDRRVPTVSFTHARHTPAAIARHLAQRGIFAWHGNFYALPLTESLGLEPDGFLRVGLLHYNTLDEIDRLAAALRELESP